MIARSAGFVAILSCVVAACNGEAGDASQHQQQAANAISAEHRPAEKTDSIRIEGMSEPLRLNLAQPSSSIPFATYVPADMKFEEVSSGEGEGYYFYTNFAGKKNEHAYLLIFIVPPNTNQLQAVQLLKAYAASRGNIPPAQFDRFSFTRDGVDYLGSIELRMHGDRFYYIAQQYPVEYAEGFVPRAQRIMNEWQWLD